MSFCIKNPTCRDFLRAILIGIFIVVISFPEENLVYSVGIDSSLKWLYNWMFSFDLTIGKSIIFPHGPLAFLMYPLQENMIITNLFLAVLKILFAWNIHRLVEINGWKKWLTVFFFTYLIAVFGGITQFILGNIVLLYCNYYKHEKKVFKLLAFGITAIAFYIRSYVAILSGILSFSFLIFYLITDRKNLKLVIQDSFILWSLILLIWVLIYKTFDGFPDHVVGVFQLAQDNSSAASYYPQNEWLVLIPFLMIIFTFPLLTRTKQSSFFSVLVLLSLFAGWKHAMAREDIDHVNGLLVYLVIVFITYLLFESKNRPRNMVLAMAAIVLFSFNMKNSVNSNSMRFQFLRIDNFISFITDFSGIKEKASAKIIENISSNKLPKSIRDSIGDQTVDIYPWDYSIVSANNFNWQPRRVIQSYAAYTSWLDQKNAEHFNSESSPEFLIWELNKVSADISGSSFGSIDNRYLLNDEPRTIVQMLRRYQHYYSDKNFLVLKKRQVALTTTHIVHDRIVTSWGKWIPVSYNTNSLLRAKIHFEKTFLQRLKSFFYKDEQFWVYFKLKNGLIHKYRLVPKNAEYGVWINPYIFDLSTTYQVEKVMFQCSNQKILTENLSLEWEEISAQERNDLVNGFFQNERAENNSVVVRSTNGFEEQTVPGWSHADASQLTSNSYSGNTAFISNSDSFSPTFSYSMDSLSFGNYLLLVDCWVNATNYTYSKNASLVVEINNEAGAVLWRGRSIDLQLLDRHQWNNISFVIPYQHVKSNCVLKTYFWNKSDDAIIVDDLRFVIQRTN